MANEGSVAPKERVNIVYSSSTGDRQEQVELPFKQLILGDFTLREDERLLENIPSVRIDKDNFDDVLKGHELSLELSVPNRLVAAGEETEALPLNLRFEALRDFEPDALVEQVPELQQLILLRSALKALKGPMGNLPDFRRSLQALVNDASAREQLRLELDARSAR